MCWLRFEYWTKIKYKINFVLVECSTYTQTLMYNCIYFTFPPPINNNTLKVVYTHCASIQNGQLDQWCWYTLTNMTEIMGTAGVCIGSRTYTCQMLYRPVNTECAFRILSLSNGTPHGRPPFLPLFPGKIHLWLGWTPTGSDDDDCPQTVRCGFISTIFLARGGADEWGNTSGPRAETTSPEMYTLISFS